MCTEGTGPRNITLGGLADLGIGQTRTVEGGCLPAGGEDWKRWTDKGFVPGFVITNGEFVTGLTPISEPCGMSGLVWNYGCDVSPGGISGRRGTLRRQAYNADQTQCCLSQKSIQGDRTCNPNFVNNFATPECDNTLLEHCRANDGANWNTEICKRWILASIKNNRTVPFTALKDYCKKGSNFTTPLCQDWCRESRNNPNTASLCDEVLLDYCGRYTDNEDCKCL